MYCLDSEWMKKTVDYELSNFSVDKWTPEMNKVANDYIKDHKSNKQFIWVEQNVIRYSTIDPPTKATNQVQDGEFIYFLKNRPDSQDVVITMDNIVDLCYTKVLNVEDNMKSLLRNMVHHVLPSFLCDSTWPENIKKEFLSQTHKFLAVLTEEISLMEGKTKLYIPKEDFDATLAPQDKKDLIQRLETTLIHWSRQIKDQINNQVNQNDSDNAGPIDEILQWARRKENLTNIKEQLDKPELQQILNILRSSNSSYQKGFIDLRDQISKGAYEAEDNLRFLNSLYDPCKSMESVSPKDIPTILPSLLNCVRMIWEKSNFYNTEDRVAGLLRKISNEIIKRCREHINLSDMLDGDVEKCMKDLDDSIECGRAWKEIYDKTAVVINKYGREWKFKADSIFAQIEAFVQRCNDLKEICEGQIQFARKGKGIVLPKFSGTKGPVIISVLEEIKESFKKYLDRIRGSEQDKILDIKSTKWHDDYNLFKTGMKNLDNMYINQINFAFEKVNTIQQGAEFQEAFDYLARRQTIKSHVHKKIEKLNELMITEMRTSESASKSRLDMPLNHGYFSGKAVWVKSLLFRIEKMKRQYDSLSFIDENLKSVVVEEYQRVEGNLKNFMMEKHKEFKQEAKDLEDQYPRKLDQNILLESDDPNIHSSISARDANPLVRESRALKKGHIESNFDKSLLKLLKEVVCFKKLAKDGVPNFPGPIEDLVNLQRENLRVYRENVMLAIRDYNLILDSMSPFEKSLFKEHLDTINSSKNRGLKILKWSSKGTLDSFVKDCRSKCAAIFSKLLKFKQSKREIEDKCREISQTLKFITFDSRKVYELHEFEQRQQENRESVSKKLRLYINDIRSNQCRTYENFVDKTDHIQKAWFEHVISIDNLIEEELRKAVRMSFQEQLRAIVGDEKNKTNPTQIFKVYIVLETVEYDQYKLDFQPTTQELQDSLALLLTESIEILTNFRRMELDMLDERARKIDELLQAEKENSKVPSMAPKLARNTNFSFNNDFLTKDKQTIPGYKEKVLDDVSGLTHELKKRLKDQCGLLQSQLDPWKNKQLKLFWSGDKERYANYIIDQKLPVSSLRSTIEGYDNNQNEIQVERSSDDSICIQVDTTKIKNRLVDLIYETQKTLLTKIKDKTMDKNELKNSF